MRPQKIRIITHKPAWTRFLPEGGMAGMTEMTLSLDMLESMRLVDAEGLPQEEAAKAMGISAPTLCRLLGEARRRVATALRDGLPLLCEGGNVRLSVVPGRECRGRGHSEHTCRGRGVGRMGRCRGKALPKEDI
ncbi:DUF134 domain-containing protein [Mailhella massiliensis]|uniref:DUF134 domain-containing protein n=1 Tax=Mailhella massiliensis TaxID=1903261 RepID=A0A921DRI0_9BACT|nr:DUF134 domain-containing protein [Mailhella massiliensis]HJD96963.1 DUF134 domain-containing protein [Mailhella massiliensis]